MIMVCREHTYTHAILSFARLTLSINFMKSVLLDFLSTIILFEIRPCPYPLRANFMHVLPRSSFQQPMFWEWECSGSKETARGLNKTIPPLNGARPYTFCKRPASHGRNVHQPATLANSACPCDARAWSQGPR